MNFESDFQKIIKLNQAYAWKHQKNKILDYKIDEYIKQNHNKLLYEYSKIIATIEIFPKIVIFLKWNIKLLNTLQNVYNVKK